MRTASSSRGLRTAFGIILPLSLAAGFMAGGVGTLIYPPVGAWAGNLVCAGHVQVLSDYYTTPSGGSGVHRNVDCVSGAGKDAAHEDITMITFGLAILIYAAVAFALLQVFAAPRIRRRAEARTAFASFGGSVVAGDPSSAAELQSILAQVASSLQQGQATVTMRNVTIEDAEGDGPAERLARLRQLHEAGLISAGDYEAKKAEILSGL
jgi:hypothetical protein